MRYAPSIENLLTQTGMAWLRTIVRVLKSLSAADRLSVFAGIFLAVSGLAAVLLGHALVPHTARFWGEVDFHGVDAAVFAYFALIAAYWAIRNVLADALPIDSRTDIGVAFGLLVICAILLRLAAS